MNKNLHRLVFNAARGCIMAVAETALRCSQAGSTSVATGALGALRVSAVWCLGLSAMASALVQAQIVADPNAPATQQPTVLTTPNGALLVNIQTPSAAGVSRNTYRQFDVNPQGAVLNNSRQNAPIQLGGWVQGNPWLARGEARVIVNEVNSTNPSQLKGFVEVAGQRAEVIIANPAGINVDGAGFINASRATLTTGSPQFNDGSLEAYRVQRGTIRIDGAGLDARLTDYTGILARAVEVNARIHAQDLKLLTGDYTVAADQSQVQATPTPVEGGAPTFALDVSQLGGMYANKITLVGTEAGVGVRHHGTVSASAGDLVLSTSGWLSSDGAFEAKQGHVSLQTAQSMGLSGSVLAAGNLSLQAGPTGQGQAIDTSARVRAGLEVQVRASELSNSGSIDAQRLDIEVARLHNSGDLWQSGGQALQVQARTLRNASGAAIGAVQASAPSSAPVPATAPSHAPASTPSPSPTPTVAPAPPPQQASAPLPTGLISVSGELINDSQATLAAAGPLQVQSTQALHNAGHIRAVSLQALGDTLAVSAGTVQASVLAVNVDRVSLNGGAVVADQVTVDTNTYTQAHGAQLYSQGDLVVRARSLSNDGDIRSGARATVDVAQTLAHTGTLAAAGDVMLTADSLNSNGTIAAGLNADGSLKAFAENGAQLRISTAGDLRASGQHLAAGGLVVDGADVTLSNSQTSAHSADLTVRGTLNTDGAKLITSGHVRIEAQSLSNTDGLVYAGGTATLGIEQALNSTGTLAAAGDLTLTAGRVNSSGALAAGLSADGSLNAFAETGAQLRINTTGDLVATGKNLASGTLALAGAAVTLSNSQTSAHSANLFARGALNTDSAKLITSAHFAIEAQSLSNTDGTVYAGGSTTLDIEQALNSTGTLAAAGDLTIGAGSVNSSGTLAAGLNADGSLSTFAESGAQLSISTIGDLSATGRNLAAGALTLDGAMVSLSHSQTGAHNAGITARAGVNSRSAQVVAQQALTLSARGALDNTEGTIASLAGPMNMAALRVDNTQGQLLAGSDLQVAANQGLNNAAGTVYAWGKASLSLGGDLAHTGFLAAAGDVTVTAGSVSSSGTLAAGLNADGNLNAFSEHGAQLRISTTGDLSATGLNLAAGALALDGVDVSLSHSQTSAHSANLNARGALSTDGAKLITSGHTHIVAQSLSNAAGTLYAAGATRVHVAQALSSTGTLAAAGDLTVIAGSVNSSGTLAAGLNAEGRLNAFADDGAKLSIRTTGDLSATGQNLAAGVMALEGAAVDLSRSQTSAHSANLVARAGFNSLGAQVVTQQALVVDATGVLDNRQGRLVSQWGAIGVNAQGMDNTQGLVVASALDVNAGSGGITNTRGQLLAQGDLSLFTNGSVTNTEGLIQSNATVSIDATTLDNSQTTTDTQGIVGQDIHLRVTTLDNTQGQVLAGRDLSVQARSAINNTRGKLHAQRHLILRDGTPDTTTRPTIRSLAAVPFAAVPFAAVPFAAIQPAAPAVTARQLAITNTGGQIVANNNVSPSGSSLTVSANTLGLDGTLSSGGDMALDLTGDLITASGQTVRAGGHLSVQLRGGTFDNAGQWQAGTDLSVRADHIRNQVSGELLSQGATTLDTTQNASGTVLNMGLVDGADTFIRTHALDNSGGRVFGDRVALAADTVINRQGPALGTNGLRGGTIAARERLDIGAQHITNTEGSLIFSAGDLALGGELDTNRRAKVDGSANAQTLSNLSATIESLGDMTLSVGTLRNTNEHLSWTLVPQSQTQAADYFTAQGIVSSRDVGWQSNKIRQPVGGTFFNFRLLTRGIVPSASQYGDAKFKAYYEGPQPYVEAHDETVGSVKNRTTYYVPDAFNYGRNDPIWAAFGLTPPAWDAPGPRPLPCAEGCWPDTYPQDLAVWQGKAAPWEELNRRHAAMVEAVWQQFLTYDVYRTYSESVQTPAVTRSEPGTISAGGNLSLLITGSGLNRDSVMMAGGTLSAPSGQAANISNEATQVVAPTIRAGTTYDWGAVGRDCDLFGCDIVYGWRTNPYNETMPRQVALPTLRYEQRASTSGPSLNIQAKAATGAIDTTRAGHLGATSGALMGLLALTSASGPGQANTTAAGVSGTTAISRSDFIGAPTIGATAAGQASRSTTASQGASATAGLGEQAPPGPVLPGSSLFTIHPDSSARFVVETDARFTNYRQWLSSDYLLSALDIDPALTQKRLGDGFYEQKLIREQVAALTGYRFLGEHRSDEAQYMALMNAGATFAQAHQLRPGIALTPEQVAQLTSDIVWLVAQTVTLPDGRTTTALVPQVYLAPKDGDLAESGQLFGGGAVISGNQVRMALSGDLNNSGTIMGRQLVAVSAQNITNSGLIQGDVALLSAQNDIDITGGQVRGASAAVATAAGNLSITSTLAQGQGATANGVFASQQIDRVAGLYVSGEAGVLLASAGGDINLTAAQVHNAGRGVTQLSAAGNVNLGTVQTGMSSNVTHDARNYARVQMNNEAGSSVIGAGAVTISAGQDVNLRAADVNAQGVLSVNADGNVSVQAGQDSYGIATASYRKASGLVGSTTATQRRHDEFTTAQASELGGQTVDIISGGDTRINGSNVLADQNLSVRAGGNLIIEAAQNTQSHSSFNETKKSGVSASGGVGVTIGKQQQSTDQQSSATTAAASTVGSIGGDVSLSAGQTYTQRGSDVLAPGGDIVVSAQAIAIEEARESRVLEVEQKSKSSGVSVGVGGALVEAAQTTLAMAQAVRQTGDARFKALGVAAAGLSVANNSAEIAQAAKALQDGDLGGAFSVNVSVGSSQSQSQTRVSEDRAQGSTLAAGGDVVLRAQGEGAQSDIVVRGSQVKAGGALRLQAEGDIALLAAQDHRQEENHQSSKSASVGASIGASGVSATLSVSRGSGNGQGEDTTQRNSHISGQRVELDSGADTTVRGAVVTGTSVQAEVGGDFTIQSLQDSSRYSERQRSSGASASVPVTGGKFSGSVSGGRSQVDANFDSVGEQSAIRAGDGGFQVAVGGQTELKGGAITSSEEAVQQDRNRFSSEGGLSTSDIRNEASYQASGYSVSAGMGGGKPTGSAGVGSDSGQASSTTQAGISGIAGNTAARTGDAETGIAPIFDKDKVKAEVQAQVAITAEFGKQASRAVGDYAAGQLKEAEKNADQAGIEAWKEGGSSRVALHALVGGLTGGASGAVGAAAASAAAPAIDELQGEFKGALKNAGVSDSAAQLIASLAGGATAATIGGAVGGTTGAATAFNADMNNRQLHPSERKLAQELAKKSGGRYTAEEIENALRSAGNAQTGESIVAGMVVDPKSRDAIYDKGAVWTVGENGTLVQVLPPSPDAALAAYIQQNTGQTYGWYAPSSTNATSGPSAPRDRLTNQPLDEKGRYTQTVVLDGQMYQPKYLPCATAECLRTASNLDMSDPQTKAYVKALDEQVFKDIGTGATVGSLVTPVGVGGAVLSGVGLLAVIGTVAVSDAPVGALRDEVIKETLESGAERFFRTVLGHTPATAARAAALINLAGGWDAFAERVKTDLFGVKVDESKK